MSLIAILDMKTTECPQCGESDDGIVFCRADACGKPFSQYKAIHEFLCEECFESFIQDGDHETVLAAG